MRIPRVFVDQTLISNAQILLGPEASHYLTRVLRLSIDAKIRVFNGQGGEYEAKILHSDRQGVNIKLLTFSPPNNSSPLAIHLGIAISRGERMDFVVQKATELGVAAITPLFSERCEVKLKNDRLEKKLTHWQKVSASACEQTGLNLLPKIYPPSSFYDWINLADADLKLILQPASENPLETTVRPASIILLIGPEGGFSNAEIAQAINAQFCPLQLGPRVLRTETAPLAALSILQYQWGDLA
ncbi:MAG: 16S rRNA (uracil(1498)-N(3))-methyltransferase [Pseudomonadales bacterium]|nr:16S rRNA (uracil(1498)-N(3))-methyltransferase [Pseudomonadales bacterium]MCP5213466.1 16S rRNA (uracil(1498)-N(3))-methyltransferase [Pseudomonadales bacterium]